MLQTLTLIQRRADDPDEVIRLVRRSERELRGWLYTPTVAESLRTAILALAADAEDSYAVTVDVVMVGETTTTPAIDALVQAVRESVVNSAKHSGAAAISVYAEAGAEEITVFVRDRGAGFDPDAIPPDRFGVRESVMARMQRHGGEAEIRSAPGSGTEVRLRLPVHAASEA
jgi:signal transduction histidine kinase